MLNYENVKTLTTEEVKNITAETVVFDASLSTHLNKIKEISDALTAELNAYKAVAKEIARPFDPQSNALDQAALYPEPVT